MRSDRTIIAYHGCDHAVAERLLKGAPFSPSQNDFDWLGRGIYFWEFGAKRAQEFAVAQKSEVGQLHQGWEAQEAVRSKHQGSLVNLAPPEPRRAA